MSCSLAVGLFLLGAGAGLFLLLRRLGLDDGPAVAGACLLGAGLVVAVAVVRGAGGPPDDSDDQGRDDWRSSR